MSRRTAAAVVALLLPSCWLSSIAAGQTTQSSGGPPANAVFLFDGGSLDRWQYRDGRPADWLLVGDGAMEVRGGDVQTKDEYQDFILHVEFMTPVMPEIVSGQARGNSGVYLQGRYEVQVLDSHGLAKLADNDCAAVYKVAAPSVDASLPPGEWQTYDITFTAPRFDEAGKKTANARVTVAWNGQVVHENLEIPGPTGGGDKETADPGPIRLQDHGNKVRYRNVWIAPTGAPATSPATTRAAP
ncbi:MAG TPA: DUF1080 domain-containing protein [Tepidisphaeraceae bacterium]|nr:DUF1080 domain-containing protein [Tepidisphaeraceae bacterium]